jgi:hypothetical protein
MSYFEDYKNERYHDENLLRLIGYLDSQGKHEIIKEAFSLDLPDIGKYESGYRKQDYDLHLEFEHAAICIETKVDSSENEYDDQPHYQSERIYENYHDAYTKETYFRFITYGASEFYVKRNEEELFSTGPYSRNFRHILLSDIITMIETSGILEEDNYFEIKEWNAYLKYEFEKRQSYLNMLGKIREFRLLYIGNSGLTDWPNNRINICLRKYSYSSILQLLVLGTYHSRKSSLEVFPYIPLAARGKSMMRFSTFQSCGTTPHLHSVG